VKVELTYAYEFLELKLKQVINRNIVINKRLKKLKRLRRVVTKRKKYQIVASIKQKIKTFNGTNP